MKTLACAALTAAALIAGAADAATFTSRTAFEAATTGRTVIDFTGAGNTSHGVDYDAGSALFTTNGDIFTMPPTPGGFHAGVAFGSEYLEWQKQDGESVLLITFDAPVTAFGMDYTELNGKAGPLTATLGGLSGDILLTTSSAVQFFGYTSETPFTQVRLGMPFYYFGEGRFPTIDNVTFGAVGVPEPGSWALMIGGFGLAGAALRRRRASAVA